MCCRMIYVYLVSVARRHSFYIITLYIRISHNHFNHFIITSATEICVNTTQWKCYQFKLIDIHRLANVYILGILVQYGICPLTEIDCERGERRRRRLKFVWFVELKRENELVAMRYWCVCEVLSRIKLYMLHSSVCGSTRPGVHTIWWWTRVDRLCGSTEFSSQPTLNNIYTPNSAIGVGIPQNISWLKNSKLNELLWLLHHQMNVIHC